MKAFLFFRAMIIYLTLPSTSTIGIEARDRLKRQETQKLQFKSSFRYLHRSGFKLGTRFIE